jgi:hypothetical protein
VRGLTRGPRLTGEGGVRDGVNVYLEEEVSFKGRAVKEADAKRDRTTPA